jgi:DNA-directed RNA polymerase specialized sigma24 family protein
MTVVNDYAEEVMGVAKAIAIHILGGEGGTDYSSWADDIAQDTMVALLEEEPFDDRYHLFAMCQLNAKHRAINFKMKEERRREIEQEHGDKINSMLTEQSAELLAADPYEGPTRHPLSTTLQYHRAPLHRRPQRSRDSGAGRGDRGCHLQEVAEGKGVHSGR